MKPYYQDEWATIYHGDCREILPTLDRDEFDLILTDPPYGTEGLAGGYGRRQNWPTNKKSHSIKGDDSLAVFSEAWPLMLNLVKTGWAQVFFASKKTPEFVAATIPHANWFGEIIWDKKQAGLGYHVRYAHENIAIFKIGEPARPEQAIISLIRESRIAELHPHEKPVEVMSALLGWGCAMGGIALDPFMGTGTTLAAAKSLNRLSVGIEVEERYCELAAKRLEQGVLDFSK